MNGAVDVLVHPEMRVVTSEIVEDGQIVVAADPVFWRDGAAVVPMMLVVGTRPLPWAERVMRELIHRRLTDIYAWLHLDLPALATGEQILATLREQRPEWLTPAPRSAGQPDRAGPPPPPR